MTNLTISTAVAQAVTSPVLEARNGHITATSLQVAEHFQKRHTNVIRTIRNLDVSEEFSRLNFEPRDFKYLLVFRERETFLLSDDRFQLFVFFFELGRLYDVIIVSGEKVSFDGFNFVFHLLVFVFEQCFVLLQLADA